MDKLDAALLMIRPIAFVIVPAWGFHEWMNNPTLGAVIGFAFMWNIFKTYENAQLSLAFEEVREVLDDIKNQP